MANWVATNALVDSTTPNAQASYWNSHEPGMRPTSTGTTWRAIVVAGSELTPAACEVVDRVENAVGTVVHLRVLPGSLSQYRRCLRIGV